MSRRYHPAVATNSAVPDFCRDRHIGICDMQPPMVMRDWNFTSSSVGSCQALTTEPGYVLVCSERQEPLRYLRTFLWENGLPTYASSTCHTLALTVKKMGTPRLLLTEHGFDDEDFMRSVFALHAQKRVPILCLVPSVSAPKDAAVTPFVGDDFVVMPWDQSEVLFRARRLCDSSHQRQPRFSEATQIALSPKTFMQPHPSVVFSDTEKLVLGVLNQSVGKYVPHARLIEELPGDDAQLKLALLRVTVYRIRRKIEPDPQHPTYLLTRMPGAYGLTVPVDVPIDIGV
jgi:two-component system KDP operon response regulator KdpE